MKRFQLLALLLVFCLSSLSTATEIEEARKLAPKYHAKTEVVLSDGSRVDLLSDEYAIEVDWAPKWAESIGQSVHYGLLTGRKPAVILLLKDPVHEWPELVRAARVCGHLGIALFIERAKGRTGGT